MTEDALIRRVEDCPSCAFDHDRVLFWEQTDVFGTPVHPPLVGYCPETGNPVALVTDRENVETVVVIN